ncbi:efflux RND transporter periplasmic adaptor subunit [Aquirhabdus sp.]|uniref:efflux RND transporter periplasmic adaptor subunit n=1 Tax=Aquirhabdus sp. TaxID=2824160 RepID=UPI00396CFB07
MKPTSFRVHPLWFATITLIAMTSIGLSGCDSKAATGAAATAPQATPVSVATVAESNVTIWNEFSGRLEAVDRVDIRSRVAGTIQSVNFREGALVKKGDLLITIDPAPFIAAVKSAEAQVASAQAQATFTKSELDRSRQLIPVQAIAQRDLDSSINAKNAADASLRSAQAALQTAQLNLGYTQVRAPVSGRVGRLEITAGNSVLIDNVSPVLTTLVSVNPIYGSFDADEHVVTQVLNDLPANSTAALSSVPIQMGTAATSDTPFKGHLQLVDNQVDVKSGTVRVRAVFDNADGRLLAGQFARLRMGQPHTQPALLINERAVGTDQNKKFVFVVNSSNKAEYREVTLGTAVDGLRIVSSGLQVGDRIVVNGVQRVQPGALIAPQMVPMKTET